MGILILLAAGTGLVVAAGTLALSHRMLHPECRTYAYALARGLPADPADLGLAADEITFNFADGSSSKGWIIEGQVPGGPVFVLTHGWSSSRYRQLGKASLFARFASRVVLYDLRGHGDSTAPISRLATSEADDLLRVVQQVPGGPSVIAAGTSMGAGISIVAAARDGGSCIDAVIAECPYRHPLEPIIGHLRQLRYPPYPFVWLAWLWFALRVGGLLGFDRVKNAARMRCPLLVLHGTDDPLCKLASAREIAAAALDGELVEFEGGGHGGLAVLDEQRYLEAIARFVHEKGILRDVGRHDRSHFAQTRRGGARHSQACG